MIFPADHRPAASGPASASPWWTTPTEPVVAAFLERLRSLRLEDWVAAANAEQLHAGGRSRLPEPRQLVRRTAQRIDDLLSAVEGVLPEPEIGAMRLSAMTAAIALAVRTELGPDEFAARYAGFADLIPVDSLLPDEWAGAGELSRAQAPKPFAHPSVALR